MPRRGGWAGVGARETMGTTSAEVTAGVTSALAAAATAMLTPTTTDVLRSVLGGAAGPDPTFDRGTRSTVCIGSMPLTNPNR